MMEESVIKTLCYRDIFDFPLTEEEVTNFLVEETASLIGVKRALAQLIAEGKIGEREGFYFLPGREKITSKRLRREEISERKYVRACRLARLLRHFPWVKAVFLTGALAAGNAVEEDDLDFLIITREDRVWLVRFLSFVFFTLLRKRRKLGVSSAPDLVCLNMFLSETALSVPKNEQNLFSAHEIVLAKPLWAKDHLHLRFLKENAWVQDYLPNVEVPDVHHPRPDDKKELLVQWLQNRFWTGLDRVFHKLQLFYMAGRRTREVVERDRILFHPVDLSRKVLSAYRVRLYSTHHTNRRFRFNAEE